MKAKELAAKLLKYPDFDVKFSLDVSTCEEDAFRRAFGASVHEIIFRTDIGAMYICVEAELNE